MIKSSMLSRTVISRCFKNNAKVYRNVFLSYFRNYSDEINVVKSKIPDISIPSALVHEYVWENVDKWYDKTALVCLETGRSYKYYEVYKQSKALARFVRNSLGLQVGDTAAIVLPNIPEYGIIVLALSEAGLKITTVNPLYTPYEISKQFINSNVKLIFTLNELYNVADAVAKSIGKDEIPIITVKQHQNESFPQKAIRFDEICNGEYGSTIHSANINDVFFLPYSSGTTGLPKGVELTHKSIVSNLCQMSAPVLRLNVETKGSQQDVIPIFLPMFHTYAFVVVFLNMISEGCKMIMAPNFSSQIFLKLLEYKPTITFVVPPIVLMILNNPNIKSKHLDCIRTIVSAAAPLGAADVHRFGEKTNHRVTLLQVYGMTETSPITTWQTKNLENGIKIGGSGFAVPNTECKIVAVDDPTNTGLGPNQSGELLIRGPQNMKGYHNNEKATKEVLIENGWLKTGDIAHYDEDEHFFVTDRLKELIKVKGFQVAPAELEEVLRDHPAVVDAAVVGVPHPVHGEVPKAFVVIKNDVNARPEQIAEYVSSKVAAYKALTGGVVILNSIPRNASGKLLRRELKKF